MNFKTLLSGYIAKACLAKSPFAHLTDVLFISEIIICIFSVSFNGYITIVLEGALGVYSSGLSSNLLPPFCHLCISPSHFFLSFSSCSRSAKIALYLCCPSIITRYSSAFSLSTGSPDTGSFKLSPASTTFSPSTTTSGIICPWLANDFIFAFTFVSLISRLIPPAIKATFFSFSIILASKQKISFLVSLVFIVLLQFLDWCAPALINFIPQRLHFS